MLNRLRNLSIAVKVMILLSLSAGTLVITVFGLSSYIIRRNLPQNNILWYIILLISVLFAIAMVLFIMQLVTTPLKNLAEHLQNLKLKHGDARFLPVRTNDEIGSLTAVFNDLLQELDNDAAAQEESDEIFRIVAEFTRSVIVWQLDNGDIRYITPNCKEQFGRINAEFYADSDLLRNLIDPDDRKIWEAQKLGCHKSSCSSTEIRIRTADGLMRNYRHYCQHIQDANGQSKGCRSSYQDITEQKATEQQMKMLFSQVEQAKREWEQTLDYLHDFIILTDSEHRIRRYNRILADSSGREVNELVGHDWRSLLQDIGFKFVNFSGLRGELLHHKSARTYDINVYPTGAGTDGCSGFVITLNDTTELISTAHELEKALKELNDAQSQIYQQEKMASIGQLAAGVAHEINNPMGFITSNLGSLEKYVTRLSDYIGLVEQAIKDCCDTAQTGPVFEARKKLKIERILDDAHQLIAESKDGAGRVQRIVQDLKSFSRVDQSETALIDLNEALETTINIAWNELKYVAEVNREFGDIPQIKCFPQQLNQVFLNLLINAAYALGDTRGVVTVSTSLEDGAVMVQVTDNGCGMSQDVQRRIFEPFFTTKEVGKGTGLGLSISYDIIKKHGGSIEVQSEVGKGTTFAVRLPLESGSYLSPVDPVEPVH